MNKKPLLTALIAIGSLTVAPISDARIKCWTNSEGIKECGNAVPPEYAQQKHTEVSKHGVTTKTQGRAKTAEELLEEREKQRQAKTEADKVAKAKASQTALDRVLLETFSSVEDMKLAREGKISNLNADIKLMKSHVNKLKNNQDEMIQVAAQKQKQGKPLTKKEQKNITSLKKEITNSNAFIDDKHKEQDKLRERFDADIARFKKLKGIE